MTAPQPNTLTAASEERIGGYLVHPVAAMFPLLEGGLYERFKGNIEDKGQLEPIIVQGDTLIDGRNRIRACLALGIEPRVQEFKPPWIEQYGREMRVDEFIESRNLERRQLSQDQRTAVVAKIRAWHQAERARLRKVTGKSADGQAGGRGKKKNLNPKSDEGLPDHNARSTVGQVAAAAETTRHKAAQAVAVGKAAPDLLDQVAKGEVKLKDAAKKVKAAAPPRSVGSYLDDRTRAVSTVRKVIEKMHQKHPGKRADFMAAITAAVIRASKAMEGEEAVPIRKKP